MLLLELYVDACDLGFDQTNKIVLSSMCLVSQLAKECYLNVPSISSDFIS